MDKTLLARSAILAGVGFADFVLSQLDRTPSRVLEIGCGDGQAALALAASGHEVTAIDPIAPEGPIFERVTLEEFASSDPFDIAVANRSLHHVPDLALAVDKIAELAPLLIVEEFAWDRFDERTAAWYVTQLNGAVKSVQECRREWNEEHAGLHGYETLRTQLDRRFRERFFAWRPYLHRYPEVIADQASEEALIDAGGINALGFRYVGTRRAALAARPATSGPLVVACRSARERRGPRWLAQSISIWAMIRAPRGGLSRT
jgi:SAM-dependent methyltransferase